CVEAMMQDGKALQAGTSHFLGQNFAKSANISFINKQNQSEYAYTSSWGVSTRLIGGVIMTHADDEGMVVPPRIAPYQIVIVPVVKKPEDEDAIMAYIKEIQKDLAGKMPFGEKIRVKLDKRDRSSVDKFWEWTRKGAPIILEIGKRDADGGNVMLKTRIKLGRPEGKLILTRAELESSITERLENIQKEMFETARKRLMSNIRTDIKTPEAFEAYFRQSNEWIEDGREGKVAFVRGKWCADPQTEEILKAMKITIRCIPFDQSNDEGVCLLTGKPATLDVIYARSY
ncbi:MAG: proline--tRNA ligase, partial [Alphaproteobacteria bacterium]|nr:proline--tRNA ligase [Alphaproteobacteria bacterium]